MATTQDLDPKEVGLFALKVYKYREGERISLLIHLGDRLGLFTSMWDAGPLTAQELAGRTGLHERWLREWLRAMGAAELLDTDDGETFELNEVGAAVLADEQDSLYFAAGAFGVPPDPSYVDRLAESFQTGIGLTYDDFGEGAAHSTQRMLGPWSRLALVPFILPAIDGVTEALQAGAEVVDVGCGAGVALATMAEAFPKSRFLGVDPSEIAIGMARQAVEASGLENLRFEVAGGESLPSEPTFDLVLTFDCLHDMPRPKDTIAAIATSLKDDGVWLCKDIKCGADYTANERNPLRAMMYAISVTSCMASAMSEPDGAGLGTLGLPPEVLEEYCTDAGFGSFTIHDFNDPANLYYEIRR
jgi:2-polyprenyl-3-methyl-5-hydroxy-6-metoxy-1,4-benzoquinol methylase